MKKLILLLTAVLAALVIMLLSSIGQAQDDHPIVLTGQSRNLTQAAQYNAKLTQAFIATKSHAAAVATSEANGRATNAVHAQNVDVDVQATDLQRSYGTPPPPGAEHGCGGGYHDAAHEAACDAFRTEFQARHGSPCRFIVYDTGSQWECLFKPDDGWPGRPTEPGSSTGPGGPTSPGGPTDPGGPSGPGGPTGPVHTVGEGLFDIDAAATALHQMVQSPAATPAFRSICDLPPPRSPAEVVACDLYKAAYRLRHGNPCRHNDEGEAVCLH